ncbi:hypothetical protein LCGC14_2398400 [marine sediment metagenome]|uniref:Uncharacterized protein n=1 Tax=marine sediment metagenome TaxID=412755 RepID=A0A0F9EQG2_9ZZZZ
MSWLEDYRDRDEEMRRVKGQPISADLEAWEKYVDDGMYPLAEGLSFLAPTQEDADIGEEVLDA